MFFWKTEILCKDFMGIVWFQHFWDKHYRKVAINLFLFHAESLCLYKVLPTNWFCVCYNMEVISLLNYAITLIYWSLPGCKQFRSYFEIWLKHYNHGLQLRLVKREPGTEIPPPLSFHQKEVMNFKTPRCRGLNSGSATSKSFSNILQLSGDCSWKSLFMALLLFQVSA